MNIGRLKKFTLILLAIIFFTGVCAIPRTEAYGADNQSFKIVIMPDTQVYSNHYPQIYNAQTRWLAENYEKENIKFVMHLGDVVDWDSSSQWTNADNAMKIMDNAGVPYGVAIGNHDLSVNEKNFVKYFGKNRMQNKPGYLGHTDDELSSAYKFNANGMDFLVIFLNIDATDSDLAWAQGIVDANKMPTIVVTHTLIGPDGTLAKTPYLRKNGANKGNSPQEVFDKFISPNNQIFMTFNGHDHGAFNIIRSNKDGLEVNQYLNDYQGGTKGGNGYLRIIEFDISNNKIKHTTYSPFIDKYMTDGFNQFEEDFDFQRRFNNENKTYKPGEIIKPIVADYSSFEERWGFRLATQLTDGSGIIGYKGQKTVTANSVHESGTYKSAANGMWNSIFLGIPERDTTEGNKNKVKPLSERNEYVVFDLGQRVSVEDALIWQFGEGHPNENREDQGAKEIDVLVSSDGDISNASFTLLKTITLEKHDKNKELKAQIKNIAADNVRFIKFLFKSNYGDERSVGLSEVRFTAKGGSVTQDLPGEFKLPKVEKPTEYSLKNEFTIAKTDSATPDGWANYIGQSITPFKQGIEGKGDLPANVKYALLKEFTVFIFTPNNIPEELYAYNIYDVPADTETLKSGKYTYTLKDGDSFTYEYKKIGTAKYKEELSSDYTYNGKTGKKAVYVFETPILLGIDEEIMLIFNKSTGLRYWQSTEYDGGYAVWTNGSSESGNYRIRPFKTDLDFEAKLQAVEVKDDEAAGNEVDDEVKNGGNNLVLIIVGLAVVVVAAGAVIVVRKRKI